MKKLRVLVVNDYVDTQFSKFAIEYLSENAKVRKTVLPVHIGPRTNLLSKKNGQQSCDTVPLTDHNPQSCIFL